MSAPYASIFARHIGPCVNPQGCGHSNLDHLNGEGPCLQHTDCPCSRYIAASNACDRCGWDRGAGFHRFGMPGCHAFVERVPRGILGSDR